MVTTAQLVAGAQDAWASLMTTELNSIASGNAILGSTAIDNSTNLDLEASFSFVGGGSITTTGSPYLGLYLFPRNGDNSTYGDGRFGSSAAGPPSQCWFAGWVGILVAGAGTVTGTFMRADGQGPFIRIPRGHWKPVLYNGLGVGLSSSGNILYWRSTNVKFV